MDPSEQEYQNTLDYIYRFVDFSLTRSFKFSDDQFNLERMRDLLHLLGDPQNQFKAIHVAGTKGKGSVSAFIASALKANGYRTGLYTSPHLQDYNERIQVNNQPISHREFIYRLLKSRRPSLFIILPKKRLIWR
jgi:dihydrofolate synthase/folylpolyglutamate synthase